KQGNTNKAIEYLERCLLIMEYPTNRNHFFLGTVCDNLGRLYFSLGHMGRAKELITRGHEITKKRLGANHPHLAINMVSLGRIHLQQNEPEQAEVWFLKALENLKGPFGKYHSRTLGVVESLRQLYADLGETEKEAFYARWLEKGQEYDETGTPQHYKF
ncbi:MAG: tetratricopeptide repeat protein, partial [Candidatus Cloacimonetes bacterium]|nr:tetratricopeptide repeat protein [Candidatus Cloacimonadota bacterium]